MSKKTRMLIAVLLVVAAITSTSCTQRGRGRGDDKREAYQPEEFHILGTIPDIILLDFNLTADQASKIAVLREKLIQELKPLQEKINFERELQKSQYATGYNREKSITERPSPSMQFIQGMMNDKRTQYLQALFQMLTPEQKTMWKKAMRGPGDSTDRKMGAGMDDERGPGGGGRLPTRH